MLLGALIDAGVPLAEVRGALGSLAIDAETVWTERVTRAGLAATKFCVRGEDGYGTQAPHTHDDGQGHARHDHAPHRTVAEITTLIEGSALSRAGKDRAVGLFNRLAEAEAAVHDTTLDQVHLHEVGAIESIIDIVGTVHALEHLAVDRIEASQLNVRGGPVRS